jgi:hypothetical protein
MMDQRGTLAWCTVGKAHSLHSDKTCGRSLSANVSSSDDLLNRRVTSSSTRSVGAFDQYLYTLVLTVESWPSVWSHRRWSKYLHFTCASLALICCVWNAFSATVKSSLDIPNFLRVITVSSQTSSACSSDVLSVLSTSLICQSDKSRNSELLQGVIQRSRFKVSRFLITTFNNSYLRRTKDQC